MLLTGKQLCDMQQALIPAMCMFTARLYKEPRLKVIIIREVQVVCRFSSKTAAILSHDHKSAFPDLHLEVSMQTEVKIPTLAWTD